MKTSIRAISLSIKDAKYYELCLIVNNLKFKDDLGIIEKCAFVAAYVGEKSHFIESNYSCNLVEKIYSTLYLLMENKYYFKKKNTIERLDGSQIEIEQYCRDFVNNIKTKDRIEWLNEFKEYSAGATKLEKIEMLANKIGLPIIDDADVCTLWGIKYWFLYYMNNKTQREIWRNVF